MMGTQSNFLKWAKQLNTKVPPLGARIRRKACEGLAANGTATAVPFLVSALFNSNQEVRRIAQEGLESLNTPESIDALSLGCVFTKQESLRRILEALGCDVQKDAELPSRELDESAPVFTPSEKAWQFDNAKDGTILGFIPEGDFLAGRDNFKAHLPPYYLGLACVTNIQYARFLTECRPNSHKLNDWVKLGHDAAAILKTGDIYKPDPGKTDLPVVWVTWRGAMAYCKWAGLRLPSELEWEKGARGVDGRLYPWGDEWEQGRPLPTTDERKPEQITSVWTYPTARSAYGLYQMIGNVYEWCGDPYEQDAYKRYSQGDFSPPRQAEHKVLRGGPWCFGTPAHLRTEYRDSTVWRAGTLLTGFRCAKDV
jgi:formylglycine-generating enzyme required for sulfatase activity